MNITIDLNIKANEELANALLTLAAVMHNNVPNYTEEDKASKAIEEKSTIEDKKIKIEEPKQHVTLEIVRAKLAELSKAGKQAQVKALIKKFGAKKLTEISEENYEALLKEAEEI